MGDFSRDRQHRPGQDSAAARIDSALYDTKLPQVEQFIQKKETGQPRKTASYLDKPEDVAVDDESYDSAEFEDDEHKDPDKT